MQERLESLLVGEGKRNKEAGSSGEGRVLTSVEGVVVRRGAVASGVECFLAPAARIPGATPGVVVIGTRSGFHLLLQDHPPDATPDLRRSVGRRRGERKDRKKG